MNFIIGLSFIVAVLCLSAWVLTNVLRFLTEVVNNAKLPKKEEVEETSRTVYQEFKRWVFLFMAWVTLLFAMALGAIAAFGPLVSV